MSNKWNLAATGHRPPVFFEKEKYCYDPKHQKRLIEFAEIQIQETLKENDRTVAGIISGCAQGWDNAVAHAALNLKLPLLAAVPFEGMDAKWPEETKKDFKDILDRATKVVIVSEGGYENKKFFIRDKYMVDNCNLVLACHNGSTEGGTAITVKYANEVKKPIRNCWERWREFYGQEG